MGDEASNAQAPFLEFSGKETDIVILIIGPIGAGKSTFINTAFGDSTLLDIGHGMGACTKELFPVAIHPIPGCPNLQSHRLVLVDTPGFDNSDPKVTDKTILTKIDRWLGETYPTRAIVGGVLYIHDITNKKFREADKEILRKIGKKYGHPGIRKTIFTTTNWGPPPPEKADRHESELKDRHWRSMTNDGAKIYRFEGDYDSAWKIINDLLVRVDLVKNDFGLHLMQRIRKLLARLGARST